MLPRIWRHASWNRENFSPKENGQATPELKIVKIRGIMCMLRNVWHPWCIPKKGKTLIWYVPQSCATQPFTQGFSHIQKNAIFYWQKFVIPFLFRLANRKLKSLHKVWSNKVGRGFCEVILISAFCVKLPCSHPVISRGFLNSKLGTPNWKKIPQQKLEKKIPRKIGSPISSITRWWFQPIWKIFVKLGIFPK